MRKPVVILLILFLCFSSQIKAQILLNDSVVRMSGIILDDVYKRPVAYVNIFNKRDISGTMTDTAGRFSLLMSKNDTLYLSALGFRPKVITVPDSLKINFCFLTIVLNVRTYTIKTVSIYGLTEKEQFQKDFVEYRPVEPKQVQNAKANFPDYKESIENTTQDPAGGISLGSPFTALYEQFSKEGKSRRKLAELEKEDERKARIKERFSDEFVYSLTGLEGDTLKDFKRYCRLPASFVLNASDYELILEIKIRYHKYIQVRGIKPD